jgi:uncharacterized membrane protein
MRITSMGHAVFAATFVAIGILGLIEPDYAALWNGVPKGFPAREALPWLCALVSIACGLGLLWPRTATVASRVLLAYLLAWALIFKGRFIILAPAEEGSYQSIGENAVIVAAAWALYAWLAGDWDRRHLAFATGERGVRIARVLYALALIAFGLSHFFYLQFTAPLIPEWIPGHVFWAYHTGAAYLAAGVAVLTGVWARLAALLSAVQMAGFLLLVWLPLMLAGKMSTFNWGEVVVTWVLVASAWVVVDSYRGMAWLAVGKR